MIRITFPDGGTAVFSDATTLGRMTAYLDGQFVLHYEGNGTYSAEPVMHRRSAEVYEFAGGRRVTLPALMQEQAS